MAPDMDGLFLLTKVTDGDTVRGSIHLNLRSFDGWTMYAWREDKFRLVTLDTPERGEVGWAQAKADVEAWLSAPERHNLGVRTYGRDSFGRMLADIYDSETGATLTEHMLRERGWEPWVAS